jgi:crotonobetainyl-CoA:carnitine CoA-transferase CaiB-like acyl-CoA transferase
VERPVWLEHAFDLDLVPDLDALFAERTRDEWDAVLRPADCCGEPVLELAELRAHPLFAEAFVAGLPRTFPALVPLDALPRSPAPGHGEHTTEVLAEWA